MNRQQIYRFSGIVAVIIFVLTSAGCGSLPATPSELTSPPASAAPASPIPATPESTATTGPQVPISGANDLYKDNFTDPATGWPEEKFDNYFIGYHEPEYYHIEINSPHYKTAVFEPKKESFEDFTAVLAVFAVSAKTAAEGDFRYGLAFRRSGDQYYAFTVSPRTKKWFVLKSTPDQVTVLKEGTDENMHALDTDETLRVDAHGPDYYFHIGDQLVGQVSDSDYLTGEVGLYAETFDCTNVHVHFDDLDIRDFEAPQPQDESAVLYQDDFTNPATNWPEKKFDNYFIGYHEPEYYHVEVTSPNYKTTVFLPEKQIFSAFTAELDVFPASSRTAPEGDFRYGLAFRRSGDQYYAFTVSPRTKKWFVLKSSPSGVEVLTEGTNNSLHEADTDDTLRVDAQGSNFLFHINDQLVGQVTDADYSEGEIGFYVESFDSKATHIHFDKLTIRNFEVSLVCDVGASALNVRSGPSTKFSSTNVLSTGAKVIPVGINPDGDWIKIKMQGTDEEGWVFYSPSFLSCNASVKLLPVINP